MTQATAQATASTGDQPQKAKGSKPTHRLLTSATEANGKKTYQEVGALWPHKDGKGFSVKLKVALKPEDNLMVRVANGGAS